MIRSIFRAYEKQIAAARPSGRPIAGHTVTLDAGAIYALETDAPDPEVAFVAAVPGGYVTEASGQVIVHGLAVGAPAA